MSAPRFPHFVRFARASLLGAFSFCIALFAGTQNAYSAIPLDGKAGWTTIMYGVRGDPIDDSQAGAADTDIVGDASHGSLYTIFDDNGTVTTSDDTLLFRMRIGNPTSPTNFAGVGIVGMDANADGKVDLFMAIDGRNNTRAVLLLDPGAQANISPNTTSTSLLPAGWLPNNGIYSFNSANYLVAGVTSANDPHWNSDSDLDDDGKQDAFVTWRVPMPDLATVLAKPSAVDKSGNYGSRGAAGIAGYNQNTVVRYVNFTQTQHGPINGDLNGIGPSYDRNATFAELGAFTAPMSAANPVSASDKVTIAKPVDANGYINAAEDDSVVVTGTATANGWVKLTISDTSAGTADVVVWVQANGTGSWTTSGLNLSGLAEGTLTFTADLVTGTGSSTIVSGATSDTTSAIHDTIPPQITVAALATAGTPTISGTSVDIPAGSTITVSIDPNGDGTLSDAITYSAVVGAGGAWSVDTSSVAPATGTLSASGLTAYAAVTATGSDAAGNTASALAITKPTVTPLVTNDTTPAITGTWGGSNSGTDSLTVTVNSVVYSVGVNLVISGTSWTLTIPGPAALSTVGSPYSITATTTRGAASANDPTASEVQIVSGPAIAITSSSSQGTSKPTIAGTSTIISGFITLVIDPNNDGILGDAVTYSVPTNASGGWTLNTGTALPLSGTFPLASIIGTMGVTATATDSNGSQAIATQVLATTVRTLGISSITATAVADTTGIINNADTYINRREDDAISVTGISSNAAGLTVTVTAADTDSGTTNPSGTATIQGDGSWTVTGLDLSALRDGYLTFTASITGATASNTAYIHDATVPQIRFTTPSTIDKNGNATGGAVSGSSDLIVNSQITVLVGSETGTATVAANGDWSFTHTGTLGGSTVSVTATPLATATLGMDLAGNKPAAAISKTFDLTASLTLATNAIVIGTIAGDNVIVDAEAPSVVISGTSTLANGTTVSVTITKSDGSAVAGPITTTVSGGNWSIAAQNLSTVSPNGTLVVTATATSTYTYTDVALPILRLGSAGAGAAPTVLITSAGDANLSAAEDDAVTITGTSSASCVSLTISDTNGGTPDVTTTVSVSGGVWTTALSPVNLSSLAEGTLTIVASVTANSQTVTDTALINHDTIPPLLTFTSGPSAGDATPVLAGTTDLPGGAIITLAVDADSNGTTDVTYRATVQANGSWNIDTGTATPYSGAFPASGLSAVSKVTGSGTDLAGNSTSLIATTIVAITTDTGVNGADFLTNDRTLIFSGKADPGSTVAVSVGVTSIGSTTANGSGAWALDYTGTSLAANTYSLTAVATKSAGLTATATQAFTVDLSGPAVAITSITNDTGTAADFRTNDAQLIFNGTADNGSSVLVTLRDSANAVVFTATVSPTSGAWSVDRTSSTLADGTYSLSATATDAAGNSASATQSIVIDTSVTIAITTNATTSDDTPLITGTTDIETGRTITVSIDPNNDGDYSDAQVYTTTVQAGGTWSVVATTPLSGTVGVRASGTDANGNLAVATKPLTINLNAPTITITEPIGDGDLNATEDDAVVIAGATTFVPLNGVIQVTITDGSLTIVDTTSAAADGSWSLAALNLSSMANGVLTVTATYVDDSGTPFSDLATVLHNKAGVVTIDSITNDTSIISDFITSDNTLKFNGSAGAGASVLVTLTGSSGTVFSGTVTATAGGAWTYDYTASTLADGTYTLTANTASQVVVVTTGTPAGPVTVTAQTTFDTTPVITGTANVGPGESLTVTVDGVTYTTTGGHLSLTGTNWTLNIPFVNSLIPASTSGGFDGVYEVTATIRNTAGGALNDSTTDELTISDLVAPVIDLDPATVGAGNIHYSFISGDGTARSLDNGSDPGTVVESSDQITEINLLVGGLLDGAAEKLIFGVTTVAANGSSGTLNDITVGGVRVNLTYAGGSFSIEKFDFTDLTAAEAQAIVRDVQYQHTGSITDGVRTVAFTATDAAGNTSAAAIASIMPANDVPVVDLNGAGAGSAVAVTWNELANATHSATTVAAAATLTDSDNTNLTKMTITVSGLVDGNSERLVIGGVTFPLGTAAAGTDIGAFLVSYNSGTGVVTITPDGAAVATVASFQALLRGIQYNNISDNATAGDRLLAVKITDAGTNDASDSANVDSLAATATITVTPTNDQPVISSLNATSFSENAVNLAAAVIDSDVTLTDIDSGNYAGGTLSVSGLVAGQDAVSLPTGSAAVNGSVRANGANVEYHNGTSWTVVGAFSGGSGADYIITLNAAATTAMVERIIEHLRFANASQAPNAARTLTLSVDDGDGNPVQSATVAITIVLDNDAPTLSATLLDTTYVERAAATALAGGTISVTDPDANPNFYNGGSNVGTLTLALDGYVAGDTLTVANVGTGAGQIGTSGSLISYGGTTFASMTGGSAAGLVITFNSNTATPAAVQALLAQLRFSSSSDDPTVNGTDTGRVYTVTLNDGANTKDALSSTTALTASITGLIDITAINSRPVLTAGAVLAYTEQNPPAVIDNTITLSDADDTQISGARVTISSGKTAGDTLAVASQNGISGVYDSTTGVLTLTGTATLADYRTALRSVTFNSTSDTPTASSASRTVSWEVTDANSDGAGAQTSLAGATSTINITPVNDAPVNTLAAALSVYENASLSFTGGGAITVDDADLDLAETQVTATHGTLAVSVAGGASISAGASGSASLTLAGTQTQINAALATLVYTPTAHYNGPALVTVVSTDSGTPVLSDTDAIAITVDPVNSAPSGSNGSFAMGQNSSYTLTALSFGFTDANDSPANTLHRVRIATLPNHGSLTNNGGALNAGDFVAVADITAGLLIYTPVPGEGGAAYASFTFQVEDDGGIANGGVNLDASPNTLVANVGGSDPQHICFCPPTKASRYDAVTLTATASSGLAVTFEVDSGPGSITGNVLTFSGAGAVVVKARQAGDGTYAAAPDKLETIQAIDFYIPSSVADGWTVTYGGEDDLLVNRNSEGRAMAMQVVGNFAVSLALTGSTTNTAGDRDIYTAKYDANNGEKLWSVIHGGDAALFDEGAAVAMDSAGNVWIAGMVTNANKNTDLYVAKYASADGALVWEHTFRGANGTTDTGNDGPGGYSAASPYQGGDFRRNSIALTPDGGVVITGYITKTDKKMDAVTLKYAANGSLAWSGTFNGTSGGADYGQSVAVDAAGDVFVSGASVNATIDALTMKYNGATGARIWDKTYDGGKPDAAVNIKIDSDGHPVISGYSQRATFDFMTARYDSADGSLIWIDLRDGPSGSSDMAWDFALTDGTRPIVTGTSYPSNGVYDGYTFTYNCPCSANPVAWAQRFEGPAGKLDQFLGIGTDMFGNPVVTGFSQNANGTYDTQTVKYAAADGTVLWSKRYNGSADGTDLPRQILVDPAGNTFIAGFTTTAGGATASWVTRYVATEPATAAAQIITFLTPPSQGIADSLTLTATASSGLAVDYQVFSGPAAVTGSVVTFTGMGSVTIRATQAGDSTHDAATPVDRTFTVGKSRQVIVFNLPATTDAPAPLTLGAVASSGLPITYTVVSGPATLSGASLILTGPGDVTVRASQDGDSRYLAAASVEETVVVSKGGQTIDFALPAYAIATDVVPLTATASSTLPITYNVVSGPGAISGGSLTFTGAGTVSVRASQSGDAVHSGASAVTRTIIVKKAPQTIAFSLAETTDITTSLTLGATASSGLPVTYSVSGPGSLSGATLTFTGAGVVKVNANQAGSALYSAAPVATRVITVVLVNPVLAPVTLANAFVGEDIDYRLSATHNPAKYVATGLPPGVNINALTGVLSGRPASAKMVGGQPAPYTVTFTASNGAGNSNAVTTQWTILPLEANLVGAFNGLADPSSELSLTSTATFTGLGGAVSVTTTKTATYSGKVTIDTVSYPLAGQLTIDDGDAASTCVIKRKNSPSLTVRFDIDSESGQLTGTVTDGIVPEPVCLSAWRNAWNATSHPATAYAGAYTSALEMDAELQGSAVYPQGNGFGTLKISTGGIATWSGKMADGTPTTASTTTGPQGQIALHIPLYTPSVVATAGAVNGWICVDVEHNHRLAGDLAWKKNPQGSTSTTRIYRDGFPSHRISAMGGRYLGTPMVLPPSENGSAANNAVLTFSESGIESSQSTQATQGQLRQAFRLASGGTVTMPSGWVNNPANVRLSLNKTTGVFSGTFTLKDPNPMDTSSRPAVITRTVSYTGVMVSLLNQGVGHFILPQLPSGLDTGAPPQMSGQVLLESMQPAH